jgi:hypothetical protein
MEMWVFWVPFSIIAILLVSWMVRIERERNATHIKECQDAAIRLGASYEYNAPDTLIVKIRGLELTYSDGNSLRNAVRDVFTQRSAAETLYVFLHEHRGSKPGGVGGSVHRETVGCLVSTRLQLPPFRLSPERAIEKIATMLGARDIDFSSHPGFSRSYFLVAQNETAARNLFDSAVLDYFDRNPGFHVEGNGDTLVIYRFDRTVAINELQKFFDTVRQASVLFK